LVTSVDVPSLSVNEVGLLDIANHQTAAEWMRRESVTIRAPHPSAVGR
jgi:hypothetical protein